MSETGRWGPASRDRAAGEAVMAVGEAALAADGASPARQLHLKRIVMRWQYKHRILEI